MEKVKCPKASAAIPRIYRLKFQRDIYKDLRILEKSIGEGDEENSNLDLFSLEMFENIAYSSLFLALGKGIKGFLLGACRQGICFVPVILLLPKICGINGILYAQPIADVLSAVITIFMAWQIHRELRIAEEQICHDK